MPKQTASQTVGPFFSYCLTPEAYGHQGICDNVLAGAETMGARVRIEGRVFDGAGVAVPDALIEAWQANAHGRYDHPADDRPDVPLDPAFHGFGRAGTDRDGRFWFETIKPGPVPGAGNTAQAPHVNLIVFARGMTNHVYTRLYFADEAEANGNDPVLTSLDQIRRGTLIAEPRDTPGGIVYDLDIHLQGTDETVFFDA